jgi:hypothetical protein
MGGTLHIAMVAGVTVAPRCPTSRWGVALLCGARLAFMVHRPPRGTFALLRAGRYLPLGGALACVASPPCPQRWWVAWSWFAPRWCRPWFLARAARRPWFLVCTAHRWWCNPCRGHGLGTLPMSRGCPPRGDIVVGRLSRFALWRRSSAS